MGEEFKADLVLVISHILAYLLCLLYDKHVPQRYHDTYTLNNAHSA